MSASEHKSDLAKWLRSDETLDALLLGGLHLIQPRIGYRFSMEAILLSYFLPSRQRGTIVELGSGNGVIPLLLSVLHPRAAIWGVELQSYMVERSRRSIELNQCGDHIRILHADIRNLDEVLAAGMADLVLSNPPFWKSGEGKLNSHPEAAMARHELTLNLEQLLGQTTRLLRSRGSFYMIHRAERLPEIMNALLEHDLQPRRLRAVHSAMQSPARLFLIEAQKESRGRLVILPPLFLRDQTGDWSEELKLWYGSGTMPAG